MTAQAVNAAGSAQSGNSVTKVIFASAAGTMIEWYDFYLFALIGTVVAPQFYQSSTELGAVISWLATFAVGFIVRPFGAIVFGRVGDLVGRKYTFLVTMSIMGLCTFAIGLLPTRAAIGDLAGVLLISLRILQGLALGGEYGGAATYIAEHAPQGKRGAYTSWIQTTATLGLFVGLIVVLVTRTTLGEQKFAEYGWRIPFLASIVLIALSLYIRLSLKESPLFAKLKSENALSTNPIRDSFGNWFNLRYVLLALFGATMGQGVVWYTGQFYALFYLTSIFKVPLVTAYTIMGVAVLLGTPFFVIFGAWSDRIGRKRLMLSGMLFAVLTYIPIYWAIGSAVGPITAAVVDASGKVVTAAVAQSPNVPLLIFLVFLQVIYVTLVYAPIAAFLVELFPTKIRYTSMSLPYHIGNGVFGGLVPVFGLILIQAATDPKAQSWLTPLVQPLGYYAGLLYPMVVATVCFVVGLVLLPETKDVDVMAGNSAAGDRAS
ncbi:MAG: MFS transporter [Phycisphaerae bacterium]|nr:MFS transporter [Gemmatimonadaceae bacterium]